MKRLVSSAAFLDQLDPNGEIGGWHIDATTKTEIDAILRRYVPDPSSPAFVAPPRKRPPPA